MNLFRNFYSWFHSHLLSFTPSSAGLISFTSQCVCTFFTIPLPPNASSITVFTHFALPPSLSVYLSTFTVTALESQESKLPPSLSLPTITADPRFSLPLHLFPSQRLRFISLCVSGVWRVPFISPQGSQLCPVLVTHSRPPCPTLPLTLMNTYSHQR